MSISIKRAKQLKALRKKFGLGEFRTKKKVKSIHVVRKKLTTVILEPGLAL
jgi:hypothetical protein